MVALSEQLDVRNEIPGAFRRAGTPWQTDSAERTTPSWLVPEGTAGKPNPPRDHLSPASPRPQTATTVLPQQGIAGVVAEVHAESITVQCWVGGEEVEINLPSALFPADLQSYGKTVLLALDNSGGYQRPVVRERAPSPRDLLPGESELDAWVNSL
ncbi:hypothetical protein BDS110ZK18_22530 [Bradyrhizobium diazoefficiens]|uniref:Uncharacterized protein n=1 Tax=Bradyrhizobium diazoefficiens TaxID=1355477 RepID=A0A809Y8F3_9BRAD|nr:hypothetical protein XF2B_78600 [Bradyrhizobium diazoefficiens]BCF21169.1 hypothetical protein XF13B_78600 [Bradyrhizobium diazoefficiens]